MKGLGYSPLAAQLVIEFTAAKERLLRTGGGQRAAHFEARTEGTQDASEIVKQLNEREMAGLYLDEFKHLALAKWKQALQAQPEWKTRLPGVQTLLARATGASAIHLPS